MPVRLYFAVNLTAVGQVVLADAKAVVRTRFGECRATDLKASTRGSLGISGKGNGFPGKVFYRARLGGLIGNQAQVAHVAASATEVQVFNGSMVVVLVGPDESSSRVAHLVNTHLVASQIVVASASEVPGPVGLREARPLAGGADDGDEFRAPDGGFRRICSAEVL